MIKVRYQHKLVAIRSKLFVIENMWNRDNDWEVFDDFSQKFVALTIPQQNIGNLNKIIPIGSFLYIFRNENKSVACYDIDKKEWSKKDLKPKVKNFSCVKVPFF